MGSMIENSIKLFMIFSITAVLFAGSALAQDTDDRAKLLAEAQEPFLKGEYENAIKIFDEILEIYPTDSEIFEMKGLALSNLRLESTLAMQPQQNVSPRDPSNFNKLSMLEFYKALEINPNSVLALNGMGLGFGNFGEYSEAEQYFKKALEIDPDNEITQNYLHSLEKLMEKYSLNIFENPTKKPDFLQKLEERTIPYWVKNNAGWWAEYKISDDDFIAGIEYLIKNKIISINSQNNKENSYDVIPSWIKNNAGWWAENKIDDFTFAQGIGFLIKNKIIQINDLPTTSDGEIAIENDIVIPPWIKNNAGWWADGQIDDGSFVAGIQWLISNNVMTIPPTEQGTGSDDVIPSWIKNNAGWWADGQIDDGSFVSGLQWLISNDVMTIPPTEQGTGSDDVIPGWIKNNAGWWADGQIDDNSFVTGLQWLISNGIMKIS